MSGMICRLCLNDAKLINIFDARLTNSEQLRKCILLGTGVEICRNDVVTKYVCQYCSDIAIFLYKYRKKALANDKALKELANQKLVEPSSHTKDIVKFNGQILQQLKVEEGDVPEDKSEPKNLETCKKSPKLSLAVHPTIIQLMKAYPKLKIPNNLLKCNIQPKVILDRLNVDNWHQTVKQQRCAPTDKISDMERFKLMCPGISIMKISQTAESNVDSENVDPVDNTNTLTKTNNNNNVLKKRKLSEPSSDTSKTKKSKEVSPPVTETRTKSSRKRNHQHPQIPPVDKQLPKLKIVLRKASSEESPPPKENSASSKVPEPTFNVHNNKVKTYTNAHKNNASTLIAPALLPQENSHIKDNAKSHHSETEAIPPWKVNRERIITADMEHSDNESIGAHDVSTEDLLDTVDEEVIVHCGVCDKMFNTVQQLKLHERVHKKCSICNMAHRSDEALRYHQREVCFKTVIANPPNLQLTRIDEVPEILDMYPEAFAKPKGALTISDARTERTAVDDDEVLCISDDDDDDVVLVDNNPNTVNTLINSNQEFQYICNIFLKYKNLKLPLVKHKSTETKPRIYVKYNQKNQIVLENMYPELKSYRVPVELVAKPSSFAYIAFTKKPPETTEIYCWANEPVIKLHEKTNLLSTLLSSPFPKPTLQPVLLNPNNTTQQFKTSKTFYKYRDIKPRPSSMKCKNAPKQVTQKQTITTVDEQNAERPKPQIALPIVTSVADNGTASSSVSEAIPSTSSAKDISFNLRVKTPWELNTL